jgi:hypothetical protein
LLIGLQAGACLVLVRGLDAHGGEQRPLGVVGRVDRPTHGVAVGGLDAHAQREPVEGTRLLDRPHDLPRAQPVAAAAVAVGAVLAAEDLAARGWGVGDGLGPEIRGDAELAAIARAPPGLEARGPEGREGRGVARDLGHEGRHPPAPQL